MLNLSLSWDFLHCNPCNAGLLAVSGMECARPLLPTVCAFDEWSPPLCVPLEIVLSDSCRGGANSVLISIK